MGTGIVSMPIKFVCPLCEEGCDTLQIPPKNEGVYFCPDCYAQMEVINAWAGEGHQASIDLHLVAQKKCFDAYHQQQHDKKDETVANLREKWKLPS